MILKNGIKKCLGAWKRENKALARLEKIDHEGSMFQNEEHIVAGRNSINKELEEVAKAEEISWRQKSRRL